MDIFDQYLFDEIVESYIQPDLTFEDYEEIYQRFLNLEHIPEVKPYLLSMRFLGLGTEAEPEEVLSELRTHLDSGNVNLCGLYYDMILYKNRNDKEAAEKLSEFENEGYSDNYLKEHSHLNYEEVRDDEYDKEDDQDEYDYDDEGYKDDYELAEKIKIKSMEFECRGFSGLYFTNRDVDYLNAKVYIESVKKRVILKFAHRFLTVITLFQKYLIANTI